MRKKSDVGGVSNGIVKPTRLHPVNSATSVRMGENTQNTSLASVCSTAPVSSLYNGGDMYEEIECTNSHRSRSTTPLETDLLRYLTAHIKQPSVPNEDSLCLNMTSFVIGRDEYLQGIVRLVQTDCPEVVDDLNSFLLSMKQAFISVKAMRDG
jgi:hypothetical protein